MDLKKKVFIGVSVLFILVVIILAYDMYSRTTPPWEKKKEILKKYE